MLFRSVTASSQNEAPAASTQDYSKEQDAEDDYEDDYEDDLDDDFDDFD